MTMKISKNFLLLIDYKGQMMFARHKVTYKIPLEIFAFLNIVDS